MAKNETVWGIDIGNTSLKALHCRAAAEPGKIEAIGFDFIEHSKIMSQPGAEPAEILVETLKEFLARNDTKGSKVAISVSGQNTISRFLKLPPVDAKKVSDIIKYEAKQWLPFDLQDVIWDYQPLGKGIPTSGLVLDTEIGMFAMKRDITMKVLAPYLDLGIDVDCIQSSQLAVYNYTAFDQLNAEEIDPDNPPDQVVILNVGTDATDVIITNGVTIWTRNIPIGGNSFTKAMTKTLKLTFTKAEYLKRNPSSGDDPKAVIQAMRPVFNDMLSEVQRSLEYYSSLNRKAKFTKALALGNPMKLPGLQRFLGDNLSLEVVRPPLFNRMIGSEVIASPVFKENLSSFGIAYGLVTQLLGESSLSTNLMPKDVVMNRIIREKKPWMLVAAASVLLGLTIAYSGATRALESVNRGDYGEAAKRSESVSSRSSKLTGDAKASADEFMKTDNVGKNLTGSVEGRIIWLEFLKALNTALPVDQNSWDAQLTGNAEERAKTISRQNRIYITSFDTLKISDAGPWWEKVKENFWYVPTEEELEEARLANSAASGVGVGGNSSTSGSSPSTSGSSASGSSASGSSTSSSSTSSSPAKSPMASTGTGSRSTSSSGSGEDSKQKADLDSLPGPPTGIPCRLVQLTGYHYHNNDDDPEMYASNYLRRTICETIRTGSVILPVSLERQIETGMTDQEEVTFEELGFYYPVVIFPDKPDRIIALDPKAVLEQDNKFRMQMLQRNTGFTGGGGIGGMSGMGGMDMYSGGTGAANMRPDMSMGLGSGLGGGPGGGLGSSPGGGLGGGRGPMRGMTQDYGGISSGGRPGSAGAASLTLDRIAGNLNEDQKLALQVYNFVIQFIWIETPPSERDRLKEERRLAELEKQALANPLGPVTASDPLSPDPTTNGPTANDPTVFDPGTLPDDASL